MSENKPGGPGAADEPSLVPEAGDILGEGRSAAPEGGTADELALRAAEADELRRELDETKSQLLRALADAENVRRRAQRDVTDARQYAVSSFARDLLNVTDNFQRALQMVDAMPGDDLPDQLKGLMDGVRMTERELTSVMERHGVKIQNPVGERFDPNRHQAMFEVEDTTVASGTVVQVVQAGSMIGERVLRPAMVGVAKGGPKPGETQSASEETAGPGASASAEGAGPEGAD